ncbi:ribosomal protein L11 methyltransferase [Planctomycetes bacterium CA13]|uniref:Ribosomal protein L11 methyltransferase n=2 Tax=Novipirellula herctigrandis TaxID=2527986 RepID=A0A5C5Z9C8_9BACT|nr:ribosomal protein L11 methyltransferase [Planctomycetes bacterium CA13]
MRLSSVLFGLLFLVASGCWPNYREDLDYNYEVVQTWPIEELNFGDLVQFNSVTFAPDDTATLRDMIVNDAIVNNRDVLQIGIDTGLVSLLCLQNDARKVVAIDSNTAAIENTRYNAARLQSEENLDVRLIPPDGSSPFSVLAADEKFDIVICNLPWQENPLSHNGDKTPQATVRQDAILDALPKRLQVGGRCLIIYGNKSAVERLQGQSKQRPLQFKQLDDRTLDTLSENFQPGMLIELRLSIPTEVVSDGEFVTP